MCSLHLAHGCLPIHLCEVHVCQIPSGAHYYVGLGVRRLNLPLRPLSQRHFLAGFLQHPPGPRQSGGTHALRRHAPLYAAHLSCQVPSRPTRSLGVCDAHGRS